MEPAGFDPAASACKTDALPNELKPQSCRDRNRTDMKRHVTTPLSLSATLQYACGHRSRTCYCQCMKLKWYSVPLTREADTLIRTEIK